MKVNKKLFIGIVLAVMVIGSFFVGSYMKEQEYNNTREARCITLISFALDKVENEDISDQNVMNALISNVYAAYEFCDNPLQAEQLHALWNMLVLEGDSYINMQDIEDIVLHELKDVLRAIKISE